MDPIQIQQRRTRLIKITLIALVCLFVSLEIAARLWLAFSRQIPKGNPRSAALIYYPELKSALATRITRRDGHFDVLILADSVFSDDYGKAADAVKKELERRGYSKVRIWNMARPGNSSRDSLIQYRWLEGRKFDWVIVYQGLNDLRAGAVPKDDFRKDYKHLPWYAEVDRVAGAPRSFPSNVLALPVLWDTMRYALRSPRGTRPTLDAAHPLDDEALANGEKGLTVETVRRNLKDIVKISDDRGDFLTLATYASFVDPKYDKDVFMRELKQRGAQTSGTLQLGYAAAPYAGKAMPCEVWGNPQDVTRILRAQNDAVRQLAKKERNDLADLAAQVPARGDRFIDVGHLSPAGVADLARNLAARAPKKKGSAPAAPAKDSAAATTATQAGAKHATPAAATSVTSPTSTAH